MICQNFSWYSLSVILNFFFKHSCEQMSDLNYSWELQNLSIFQTHKIYGRQYIKFLDRTGFSVSICQFRWYSTIFNRSFVRIGQWRPRLLRLWFTVGVYFGLVAMLLSICLLTLLVINTLRKQPVEQQVLTPVVRSLEYQSSLLIYCCPVWNKILDPLLNLKCLSLYKTCIWKQIKDPVSVRLNI